MDTSSPNQRLDAEATHWSLCNEGVTRFVPRLLQQRTPQLPHVPPLNLLPHPIAGMGQEITGLRHQALVPAL